MSAKTSKNSTSLMGKVMQSPPMSAEQKLALEMSADKARGNSKTPAKKSAQTPVVLDPQSVKYAELFIERIGSKSAVRATEESAVLSISAQFLLDLYDLEFAISSKSSAEIVVLRTDKTRRIVKINIALDELSGRLPQREKSERASGIKFQYRTWDVDRYFCEIAEDADVESRLQLIEFDKSTRRGNVYFESGVTLPIITRTKRETFPYMWDEDDNYTPRKAAKVGSEASESPDREVYVLVMTYSDGSHEVLRDYGVKNLQAKILRRLKNEVVFNHDEQTPEDLFVDNDESDDDEDEDSDE